MPTRKTAIQHVILWIGSVGPLGHLPASGSATVAIVGIPLFWLMHRLPPLLYVAIVLIFMGFAIWVHTQGDRILGEKDSRKLVLDELVGYLIAVAFMPFTWPIVLISFLLERVIDIAKVPPAKYIEDHWPAGWGVVGDDVVAGLYTLAVLAALSYWTPTWLGLAS